MKDIRYHENCIIIQVPRHRCCVLQTHDFFVYLAYAARQQMCRIHRHVNGVQLQPIEHVTIGTNKLDAAKGFEAMCYIMS
jgi:hypothetical protein